MTATKDLRAMPDKNVDKGIPQGADGNLDQSQIDWLRLMPDGWDGTPPTFIEKNVDGLPCGLIISKDGELLDWRGENYVRQSTLGRVECENARYSSHKHFHCSACGESFWRTDGMSFYPFDFGFCPACGRKVV